ncbi:uncharacterized protein FPRN_11306 [Fusarium proliferatum]|nr:uncharacterized protein FPRN_11306 [Fusarium proliferatum]
MSKSYDPKATRDFALEESYLREARIEGQSDGGVSTITRAGYSRTHIVKSDSWASKALPTCSGMCAYTLGRQSLEDSGHINGVFDPTVGKAVNLIDSEMTVVREPIEDYLTGTIHYFFRKHGYPTLITGAFGRATPCYLELNILDDTGRRRP